MYSTSMIQTGEVNSVQDAFAKNFSVCILKFEKALTHGLRNLKVRKLETIRNR